MRRDKFVKPTIKVLDAKAGLVHAVVSTEDKDRDGDIIRAIGWDLKNFLAHPVLLSSHDYRDIRSQIGRWESMEVKGKRLEGIAKYYVGEGNETADWAYTLAAKGDGAYSVGFIPDESAMKEIDGDGFGGHFEFNGQELLEVSHVSVPSNPRALQALKGYLDASGGHPLIRELVDSQLGNVEWADLDFEAVVAAVVERLTVKALHGEHSHEGNGSHNHDDKSRDVTIESIDYGALFDSAMGGALREVFGGN